MWDRAAWEDYKHWQSSDRKIFKRINVLIGDCLRDPFSGIGKPQQLKYGAQGAWSRRITDEHRLVYRLFGHPVGIMV